MADAWLSIWGLYSHDPTIFSGFRVPEGVDKNTAISKILLDTAELGLVYTDPDFMKLKIENWTKTHFEAWNKTWDALSAVYNPIHNYDRNEEWTDGEKTNYSDSNTGMDKRQVAGWNQDTGTNDFADADKVDSSGKTSGNGARDATHKGHLYGNIGVTTTQEMIRAEAAMRQELNMYQILVDDFKIEFCLLVY